MASLDKVAEEVASLSKEVASLAKWLKWVAIGIFAYIVVVVGMSLFSLIVFILEPEVDVRLAPPPIPIEHKLN